MSIVAFTKVGGTGNNATASTTVVATVPTGGHPVGSTVVAAVSCLGTTTVTSVTDTGGNTYTKMIDAANGTAIYASIWVASITTALAAGNSITATCAANVAGKAICTYEFAMVGAGTASGTGTATGATIAFPSSTVVPAAGSNAPMLVFGCNACAPADNSGNAPGAPWVALTSLSSANTSQLNYYFAGDTNFASAGMSAGQWGGIETSVSVLAAIQSATTIPGAATTIGGTAGKPYGAEPYNAAGRVSIQGAANRDMFSRNLRQAMTRRIEIGSTDATDMIMRDYLLAQPAGPGGPLVRSQGVKRAGSF
jgi:hypothetical protein